MTAPIRTTCPYCGVGCGVLAQPDGRVTGDPDHPANQGRLCSKGAALAETLDDRERLLVPRIGARDASWDEALDLVAERFARTIAEHGPDAVAFYVSGQCLTEDYYVANKLMKGFIGSANIDTNSRLCMASSVAGHIRAFGADIVPGTYEDLDEADLVVLVGSNMAWCHPVLFQRLQEARARRGTRLVVIDPRRSATAEMADLHLALAPGSDVALFNGLLAHLAGHGQLDRDFVIDHTTGIDAAVGAALEDAPRAAELTGLAAADLDTFYAWFAETPRVVTLYSQGVNQSSAGTDKVNAIINCHLATGRIGRPGAGPFSLTGQPNAMGGREVGGLANQLAAHMGFDDPAALDRVRRFWRAPHLATRPGLKAVDLFDAVADGRIKALWIVATNPADTLPRAEKVRAALESCPFVVVADCWPTDTTRYAHVTLPAAGWGEKDGMVTNSERCLSRQRRFRPAPGEAKPDWWMMAEVARRMGWADAFAWDGPDAIFREHAALTGFENDGSRPLDLGAAADMTAEDYETWVPAQWPLPAGRHGGGRLFGDGNFATPDGRARIVPVAWRPPKAQRNASRPFLLNTGRIRDQWHTMTRTGRVPRLLVHSGRPEAALAPADVARLGVTAGGLVRIDSEQGSCVLPARLDAGQAPGEIFVPMHWTDEFSSSGPVGALVEGALDPVSGQPELKATAVSLTPVPTRWRALLLHRHPVRPAIEGYWSRMPLGEGHVLDLIGSADLPEPRAMRRFAASLVAAAPEADWLEVADAGRGIWRFAVLAEGRLDACLFIAAGDGAALPAPARFSDVFTAPLSAERRAGLLAAAPAREGDLGPVICACFSVGLATIRRAILSHGLVDVVAIGTALRAGTGCGACRSELATILRDTQRAVA